MEKPGITPLEILNFLKAEYVTNSFQFEMQASVYLAGDSKERKHLRQEIAKYLTKKDQPATKCTQAFVSELIKASLEQFSMF